MNARRLGALASIFALTLAANAPMRIAVNDAVLQVAPVRESGRVLVPMRAIFDAIGARLHYDARAHTISADGNGHAVRLQIGDPNAVVDGRLVHLDVPARVVAASTYVPLRFIAQSLGAVVGYDGAAGLVTVSVPHVAPADDVRRVGSMSPAPYAIVASGYPTISAVVGGDVPVGTARLTVDGVDVTAAATFDGTTMTYIPAQGLPAGTHRVALTGVDRADAPFDGTWTFTTTVPPAPSYEGATPFQFYLEGGGQYGYGDEMDFVLIAPPGGSAYLTTCASPLRNWMFESGTYYRTSLRAPYGLENGYCPVEAVYIAWNGRIWYAPVPIIAHLSPRYRNGYRPHDRPTPRPTPSRWPVKPTPSPLPGPTAAPWYDQTPGPPIARPPHRPEPPPAPQPERTRAPQPERTPRPDPTQAPPTAPTAEPQTPAPPQPRPPHEPAPHPQQTPPA